MNESKREESVLLLNVIKSKEAALVETFSNLSTNNPTFQKSNYLP